MLGVIGAVGNNVKPQGEVPPPQVQSDAEPQVTNVQADNQKQVDVPDVVDVAMPASSPPSPVVSEKAGDASLYPNPVLTPGDVFDVDAATICVSGYSSSVRDVPLLEKKQVYVEYGVSYPQPTGAYEVDHFIPLEIGGSNDIKNL